MAQRGRRNPKLPQTGHQMAPGTSVQPMRTFSMGLPDFDDALNAAPIAKPLLPKATGKHTPGGPKRNSVDGSAKSVPQGKSYLPPISGENKSSSKNDRKSSCPGSEQSESVKREKDKAAPPGDRKKDKSITNNGSKPIRTAGSGTLGNQKKALPAISGSQRVLMGRLDYLPPQRASVIRVFLSSTFTDMKAERNWLTGTAYPELRNFCASLGLDFQVMDMRWGVTDFATNDHSTTDLCLKEIDNCQRLSRGPAFVVILGNKYGFRPLTAAIEAKEFEAIISSAEEKNIPYLQEIQKWYLKDENAVPPHYILQPISEHLKYYADWSEENQEKRKADVAKWRETLERMHACLLESASAARDKGLIADQQLNKYSWSVTEQEVQQGLFSSEGEGEYSACFIRDLAGLETHLSDNQAVRHTDIKNVENTVIINQEAQAKLKQLIKKVKGKLPADFVKEYKVPWTEGGISASNNEEHKQYLTQLSADLVALLTDQIKRFTETEEKQIIQEMKLFTTTLKSRSVKQKTDPSSVAAPSVKTNAPFGTDQFSLMIGHMAVKEMVEDLNEIQVEAAESNGDAPLSRRDKSKIHLHTEVLHHLHFCKIKCELFSGREADTEKVKAMLKKDRKTKPLVIHGGSGTGKTSFMAHLAHQCTTWFGNDTVVVVRFMGTSPQCSNIKSVLRSVCKQISTAYGELLNNQALKKMGTLLKHMLDLLMVVSMKHGARSPLCIILDAVDQLSPEYEAFLMKWLPKSCPPNVFFVVSMLPDMYNCLENARQHLQDDKSILQLESMPNIEGKRLINHYLSFKKRSVTEAQMKVLHDTYNANPNALYTKLILDEACNWKSYTNTANVKFEGTITAAIKQFFASLERKFGNILIKFALGYLTVGKNGLTEMELEDALSLNNDVLCEVYRYHDPPVEGIVRIPPLIWSRIRHDLGDYIVERQTFNKTTVSWYHRQFTEAAEDCYASCEDGIRLHSDLAELFRAEKPIQRSIFLKQRAVGMENADRQVILQPMVSSNLRKLTCLPFHMKCSKDVHGLKEHVFCNIHYLLCKCEAFGHIELIEELKQACSDFSDPELQILLDCVKFSSTEIQLNFKSLPEQLLGHLLGCTNDYTAIQKLCRDAQNVISEGSRISFEPTLRCFPAPNGPLTWYAANIDQVFVFSEDKTHCLLEQTDVTVGKLTASYRILNLTNMTFISRLTPNEKEFTGKYVQASFTTDNKKIVFLYTTCLKIHETATGKNLCSCILELSGSSAVNQCLSVSSRESLVALGGIGRISLLQSTSESMEEPDYKPRMSMKLSGVLATSNIIFSKDELHTISTHSVKGKSSQFGVVAQWDYIGNQLKCKLALPAPIQRGFLREVQENIVLCGCINRLIVTVDLSSSQIVRQFGNISKTGSRTLLWDICKLTNSVLVGCLDDSEIEMWDYETGKLVNRINHREGIHAIHLSVDGQSVGIGDKSGNITLQQLANKQKTTAKGHGAPVVYLRYLDETTLVTHGKDNIFKIWDVERLRCSKDLELGARRVSQAIACFQTAQITCTSLAFSHDGQFLITSCGSSGVYLWKMPKGQLLDSYKCISDYLILRPGNTNDFAIWSLNNEEKIVSAFTLKDCKFLLERTFDASLVCFGKEKDTVILLLEDENHVSLQWFDLISKQNTFEKKFNKQQHGILIDSLTLADNNRLCFGTSEHPENRSQPFTLHAVDLSTEESKVITCMEDVQYGHSGETVSHKKVYSFYPSGSGSLYIGTEGQIEEWTLDKEAARVPKKRGAPLWMQHSARANGKMSNKKKGGCVDGVPVTALVASDEGKLVVSGAQDGSIVLWKDVDSPTSVDAYSTVVQIHSGPVTSLEIIKNGKYVLTGSKDKRVKVLDVDSGVRVASIHVHADVLKAQMVSDNLVIAQVKEDQQRRPMIFYLRNLVV